MSKLPPASPRFRRVAAGLFLVALAIRLFGLDWDDGHLYHPDERRIAEAVAQMSFSPLQLNPHFFAYGSLPMMVTRATMGVVGLASPGVVSYDGAIRVGRALSAAWGAGTVLLLVLLGRRLFGEDVALLAGALLALAVSHLQNSHFATTDVPLAFLVLACLYLLVRHVEEGRLAHLAAASLVAGLALATKASAAPLVLPIALAVAYVQVQQRRILRIALWGAVAALIVAAGFAAGEPYALRDPQWWRDVTEQARMVRHAGEMPYTTQYVGTAKYLYELREIVLWGMGPLLGVAALWGTARAVARRGRRPLAPETLLLAWVVPFFLVTGWFEVKFPRYLLPIYPLLALWAAEALCGWTRRPRAGRVARGVVLGATAAYALAFLAIYARPFVQATASEWFYRTVPAGTRVLSQDWDEGFPVPRGGRTPDRYKVVQFPFYDADTPAKTARLARELAECEYVVLQTKRLYGAVTRDPARFPTTNRFFRLLFAGDLGFRLEADFASRPALFGVELPSELADESFSVYDHPKAVIFRKSEKLTVAELERRIATMRPSREFTRTDLLLARAGTPVARRAAPPELVRSSLFATLLVAAWLEIAGLVGWAFLAAALPVRRGLYAAAKVIGALLLVTPAWLAVALGLAPLSRGTLVVAVAGAAAGAVWLWRRGLVARPGPRELVLTELVTWTAFALFLLFRALNPEIYWGEKPMDSAFLRVLYRCDTLPPPEPWLAGTPLSYTYFGHFLVAAIGRTAGIDPALMFNLGIGVAAALLAAGLFAAGCALGRRHTAGVAAVGLGMFVGNLAGPLTLLAIRRVNFDYFWATSRVIRDTINEYPFWNLTFADLHAHVLAMPWAATLTAVLVWIVRRRDRPPARPLLAAGGLLLAAIVMTSGWSTPTYLALTAALPVLALAGERARPLRAQAAAVARRVAVPVAAVVGSGLLVALPFLLRFHGPARAWGEERGPWAHPGDVLQVFGVFLVVLLPAGLAVLDRLERRAGRSPLLRRVVVWGVATLAAVSLFDLDRLARLHVAPARSVFTFAVVLALLGLRIVLAPTMRARTRLTAAVAAFALGLVAGCELLFVWDRMNTVFKFYLDAWLLLAPAAGYALVAAWRCQPRRSRWLTVWRGATAAALAVAMFTAFSGAVGALRFRHAEGPRWTLDGTAFLATQAPDVAATAAWFNRTVAGTPVLVEAWGPSYQEYARVSMHTGLPIVLGWDYHVYQRGATWREIARRKAEVEAIYTSPARDAVAAALARTRAAWVVVGDNERRAYGATGGRHFSSWPDLLRPAFTAGGTTVWAVVVSGEPPPEPASGTAEPVAAQAAATEQIPLGQLREPRGVAATGDGTLLVADFGNNRIHAFDRMLRPLSAWGNRGSAEGQFNDPCAVAVGPDGLVYVADTWNARVQVLDLAGHVVRAWSADMYGPRGIAAAPDGRVYVVDTGNHRVLRFDAAGRLVATWGREGQAPGEFRGPIGATVDAAGQLWVCDNGNARLQVFDREGVFVRAIPVEGWRQQVFSEPYVAVQRDGLVWVTVPLANQVVALSPAGEVRTMLIGDDLGRPFKKPIGLALLPGEATLAVTTIEDGLRLVANPHPSRPEPTARPGKVGTKRGRR